MRRSYDRDYDRGDYGPGFVPPLWPGWYSPGFFGAVPSLGFGLGYPPAPYPPFRPRYDRDFSPRRPEESSMYGRGGDRAVRRWAQRYGYDVGYAIPPRPSAGARGGYDRPYRGYDCPFRG